MRVTSLIMGLAVLLTLRAGESRAQDALVQTIPLGAEVRLEWPAPDAHRARGTAIEIRVGEIVFRPDNGDHIQRVAFTELKSLTVSTGTERHVLSGLLFGLIAGAIAGYAIGSGEKEWDDINPRLNGAVVAGLGGGFLGAMIGSQVVTRRWKAVRINE